VIRYERLNLKKDYTTIYQYTSMLRYTGDQQITHSKP